MRIHGAPPLKEYSRRPPCSLHVSVRGLSKELLKQLVDLLGRAVAVVRHVHPGRDQAEPQPEAPTLAVPVALTPGAAKAAVGARRWAGGGGLRRRR